MFQFEWADLTYNDIQKKLTQNLFQNIDIDSEIMLIEWEEHCFECAPPLCYETCSNYLSRQDLKCRLLKYGIISLSNNYSVLPYASVFFRKWAKLETIYLSHFFIKYRNLKYIYFLNKYILNTINILYKYIPFLNLDKKKRLNGFYSHLKRLMFSFLNKRLSSSYTSDYDLFFKFSCYSYSEKFDLIFESGNMKFSFTISPGYNYHEYKFDLNNHFNNGFKIFPENNFNANLTIGLCDFIKTKKKVISKLTLPKVVVWDLDNTLWEGVLIEDGENKIKFRQNIIETIKKLDSIGIVNSIISKNNYDEVSEVLKRENLLSYFVFPKINWNTKSENFKILIKEFNILPNAFYFVDDNIFERQEVLSQFPEISCFDQYAFPELLSNPIFNISPTEDALNRRQSYKAEESRMIEKNNFTNNYINFLINCKIDLFLSKPITDDEIARAFELISRTNQLNLSGNKLTLNDFNASLENPYFSHFIFRVKDKFGDYGIVGYLSTCFKSISDNNIQTLIVENLVISCRVAEKKIENACIFALKNFYNLRPNDKIIANYLDTKKNKPIFNSMLEMGFKYDNSSLILNIGDLYDPNFIIKINILDNGYN
jgi:FkbH-like protein